MKRFFEWLGIQDAFEKGLIARVLVILCLTFICFGAVLLFTRLVQSILPSFPSAHWTDLLLESMIFAFGLIALWLIRADKMRTARWVILGSLLVTVTLQVYFVGDPANDIAGAMGLQLFGILAILLLDRRDRWIAVGLVISVFIGLNTLSTTGNLIPVTGQDPLGKTIFSIFVWLSVSIIITVVLFTAMDTLRREPQLLEQQINEATQSKIDGATQKSLPYLSTHDALTGLYNRLFFETEFTRMEKSRLFPISIIMAVVDELKNVNDNFGDSTGDQMLISVARLFSKVFRQEDIISRYGGDEFAILLPGADTSIAKEVINRIKEQINTYNENHIELPISISMGVSTANQGESLKGHLKLADKLMRQEKKVESDHLT